MWLLRSPLWLRPAPKKTGKLALGFHVSFFRAQEWALSVSSWVIAGEFLSLNHELEGAADSIWKRVQHTRTTPSSTLLFFSFFSCPRSLSTYWTFCPLPEPTASGPELTTCSLCSPSIQVEEGPSGRDRYWSANEDPISPCPRFSSSPLDCYCTCGCFDCVKVGNYFMQI